MEKVMVNYPTAELYRAGQSPWLDYISRKMLRSGELRSLIIEKGVLGVTSNPSIFQNAISQPGGGYDEDIRCLIRRSVPIFEIYDKLSLEDIRETCDLFLPIYGRTRGEHGFVSLEVLPGLAYEIEETISEAIRLFNAVNRPNILIKVPATPEGLIAIRELIGRGININVTLMFSVKHYQDVARAYLDGLSGFLKKGGDLSRVHSVASIFVSRIDTLVDKKLESLRQKTNRGGKREELGRLRGKAAVANSKMIYQEFKRIFGSEEFQLLKNQGAHIQKVLWGSTSTKNPNYSDLIYVAPLVGLDTVNTMPKVTLDALLDHGVVRQGTVEEGLDEVTNTTKSLARYGIDLTEVGEVLQKEGVKAFVDSFDTLMGTLEEIREEMEESKNKHGVIASVSYSFGAETSEPVNRELKRLKTMNFRKRFLEGDPSLWKKDTKHRAVIRNRFGWFRVHQWIQKKLYELDLLLCQIRREKIKDVVLLAMGGSSLAPEVMSLISRRSQRAPRFHILDTTDPASVLKLEKSLNLKSALFIVASKSGATIETMSQFQYFYERVQRKLGDGDSSVKTGRHFIAITDEGSPLEKLAREKKFRKVFINPSDIGGRYSALSYFGMVPAVLIGVDVRRILRSAKRMFQLTLRESRLQENPGVYLGATLGVLAKKGRNKVTFWMSKSLSPFAAWLEQLIAESTGKEGKGIVPVEGEEPMGVSAYGRDRFFVVMKSKKDKMRGKWLDQIRAIKRAGFPVAEMTWSGDAVIGSEFFRWEIATAVASIVLGINPFDEPNVRESKEMTSRILDIYRKKGKLESPKKAVNVRLKIPFESFFLRSGVRRYFALLSYTERSDKILQALNRIRNRLVKEYRVPVLVGFGPRYLHSMGQLYKGGAKEGIFFQFLIQDHRDAKIPKSGISFGLLKRAQAYGDTTAMTRKGLPVSVVELGKDAVSGLKVFEKKLTAYLEKQV